MHHAQQLRAIQGDEQVIGADVERPVERGQVDLLTAAEHQPGLLDQRPHLVMQGQRPRCRHQAATGADQNRIANRLADPPQGPAHGRRAQVHAPCSADHTALIEQRIEGDQQVHIRNLHCQVSMG
ncbi:hypothetical protein D3C80_1247260 [compost metagenome]